MSDILDKDIRIRLLVESVQALREMPKLGEQLKSISNQGTGNLNKSLEETGQKVSKISTLAKQNADASKQFYKDEEDRMKRSSRLLQSELEQRQKIVDLQSKQAGQGNRQSWIDEENAIKRRTSDLKSWLQSQEYAQAKGVGDNPISQMASYQSQIAQAKREAEGLYQAWKKTSAEVDKTRFDAKVNELKNLKKEQEAFNDTLGIASKRYYTMGENFQYFNAKFRSHAAWLISGSLLGGALGAPYVMAERIKEIEKAMAGMQQVLPELHKDQNLLNKETMAFLDIAAHYGEKIEDVVHAGQLWGRMYKDVAMVNALVGQSATLAVADNMSLVEANKALEAAMFQYGLTAKTSTEALAYSGKIIDIWTNLAHNGGVSAQDLANAVERSGSVAKQTGVDFEFLNAMVATGVRSTGRSGAEIGNMIKSVLGSFHSEKAVEEIEALGVSVTKVGKNGEKEFRKAQDVLLDITLAAQGTEQNLEGLFKAVSGGKFQWSKAAAMLGDYKEFIRTWGEAVSSTGFSAKQVDMQLDTISRKMQRLSQDSDKLIMGMGNAGLTRYIKEQITAIDNFVVGLQKIPAGAWSAIGGLGQLAMGVLVLNKAYTALTTAILSADAAQTAMAKKNVIVLALTAISFAAVKLIEDYGKFANAQREAFQRTQDGIAIKNQEINMYEEQSKFIDALITSHQKLTHQIDSEITDSKKLQLAAENRAETEKQLTRLLGEAAVKRIKDAQWSLEAIKKEKDAFIEASNAKKAELRKLITVQLEGLDIEIKILEDKIAAYYKDAEHFGEGIKAKMQYLSLWQAAQATVHEQSVAWYEAQRDQAQKELDNIPQTPEYDKKRAYYQNMLDGANNQIAWHKSQADGLYSGPLKELQKLLSELHDKKISLLRTSPDYNSAGAGGDKVGPDGGSGGSGSGGTTDSAPNLANRLEKMKINLEYNKLMQEMKQSADNYSTSLEELDDKEKMFGVTTDTICERLSLQINRQIELGKESKKAQELADKYTEDANNIILANKEIVQSILDVTEVDSKNMSQKEKNEAARQKWASLDKDTRQEILDNAKRALGEESVAYLELEKAVNLATAAIDKANDARKLTNQTILEQIQLQQRLLSESNTMAGYNDTIAKNKISRFDPFDDLKKREIELKSVEEQITRTQIAMGGIILEAKEAGKDPETIAGYKQLEAELSNLEARAEELRDKFYDVRKAWADATVDMIVNGRSFSDILKQMWKDLAKEAIYQMFRIQQAQSTLGAMAGKGKGKGATGASVPGVTGSTGNYTTYTGPGLQYHATGGIFDQEHIARFAEGNKKEAIIPLEDHTDRALGIWMQAGMELNKKSSGVVPYLKNPEVAQKLETTNAELKQNKAQIAELQRQTELMQNMLQAIISNNGNNGGIVVLQTQVSSQDVADVLQNDPSIVMNAMYKARNMGWSG